MDIEFEPREEKPKAEASQKWHRELPPPRLQPEQPSAWVRYLGAAFIPPIIGFAAGAVIFLTMADQGGWHRYSQEEANAQTEIALKFFWIATIVTWAAAIYGWRKFTSPKDDDQDGD